MSWQTPATTRAHFFAAGYVLYVPGSYRGSTGLHWIDCHWLHDIIISGDF